MARAYGVASLLPYDGKLPLAHHLSLHLAREDVHGVLESFSEL